jgi:hypothetical protein
MLNWNRRQFLSGLLTAASAGAATSVQALPLPASLVPDATSAPRAAAPGLPLADASPATAAPCAPPHGLRDLLPEGVRFGRWRVVSVLPVKLGAVPVVLETRRGERFQVDVLRRDRSTRARRGLSETREYSLFLLNRGHGDTPTQEDHGLAVLWLAAFLRPRERLQPTAGLLTQRERTQRFPRGRFNALVADAVPESTRFEAAPSEATWTFPHGAATADASEPAPPGGSDPLLPARPA